MRPSLYRRCNKFFFLLLAFAGSAAAETGVAQALESALAQARTRQQPVIAEFHAPWCYSCYYMSRNVLNGVEWEQVQRSAVILPLDADSQDGAHWMQAWNVKMLPAYVVLDAQGRELGRILGEQSRVDFYRRLSGILRQSDTLETLQAQAAAGSVPALRDVLRIHHARGEGEAGLRAFAALPSPVLGVAMRDAEVALWVSRLELLRTSAGNDTPACLKAGRTVLAGALGCERPYELSRYLACAKTVPDDQRLPLLKAQAERMQTLLDNRVFNSEGARCADERSVVLATADLYRDLGDSSAEGLTLIRAATEARTRLGADLASDRNLADNVRVYLDRAGRNDDLNTWLQRLIAAYPKDYVYSFRYGKALAAQNRHEEALRFFAQAAALSYGVNRLKVAQSRTQSLIALGRADEARTVVDDVLKANGPWFPDDVARLRELRPS